MNIFKKATLLGLLSLSASVMGALGVYEILQACVNVARLGGVENNTIAGLISANGSAVAGVDYVQFNNVTYWINDTSASKTFNVTVLDNNVAVGNRSFAINLLEDNSPYTFSMVNPNKKVITINITDDENGSDLIFKGGFE